MYYRRDPDQRAADAVASGILGAAAMGAYGGFVALRNFFQDLRAVSYRPLAPHKAVQDENAVMRFFKEGSVDISTAKLPTFNFKEKDKPLFSWKKEEQPKFLLPEQQVTDIELASPPTIYTIYLPKGKPNPGNAVRLIRALLGPYPRIGFQIVAEPGRITWRVVDPISQYQPTGIMSQIATYYGEDAVVVYAKGGDAPPPLPLYRQFLFCGLANEYPAPLPFFEQVDADPLIPLVQRMNYLSANLSESIVYDLTAYVQTGEAVTRAKNRIVAAKVSPTGGFSFPTRDDPLNGLDKALIEAKLEQPLYHCFLAITVESKARERLQDLVTLASDVTAISTPKHNRITAAAGEVLAIETPDQLSYQTTNGILWDLVAKKDARWRQLLLVLSPEEIATLWHLPDETYQASSVVWAEASAPDALMGRHDPDAAVLFGDTVTPGFQAPVAIQVVDRAYHQFITGKTGMGKSTFLHNLIHQDIAAGRGVAVLDPHGSLIDDILRGSIPADRVGDVVLLECANTDYPVPINPFRIPPGITRERVFNAAYFALRKIYESAWSESQMDNVIRHVITTLLFDPEATPRDIRRLFVDADYRGKMIAALQRDPDYEDIADFWQYDYEELSPSEQRKLARPILNRTGLFLRSQAVKYMTCHPSTLSFTDLIREKKIVLVNLFGDAIESEVGSLGALFLSAFYMASIALKEIPKDAPPRYYLYIDEMERLAAQPIVPMLSEVRKFGLGLVFSNQFLDQVDDKVLSGILGNTGTITTFEVSDQDARVLSAPMQPEVTREQLVQLGKGHMAVKTRHLGENQPAFVVKTRPHPVPYDAALDVEALKERSRSLLMRREEVQAWLDARYKRGDGGKDEPEGPEFKDYE